MIRHENTEQGKFPADRMVWAGLKGIGSGHDSKGRPVDQDVYAQTTMVAVRIKASEGISQAASSRLRVKATRLLQPATSPNGPSANPAYPRIDYGMTGNPADAFMDILTAVYGGNQARSAVHSASLTELAGLCDRHSLEFNGVFDERTTVSAALKAVVQGVPAVPTPYGFKIGVTRIKQIPFDQYMFTDYHAIEGSIKRGYSFRADGDIDGVEVEYRDPERFTRRPSPQAATRHPTGSSGSTCSAAPTRNRRRNSRTTGGVGCGSSARPSASTPRAWGWCPASATGCAATSTRSTRGSAIRWSAPR